MIKVCKVLRKLFSNNEIKSIFALRFFANDLYSIYSIYQIKQLKMREYSAQFDFSLNYVLMIFNSTVPSSLTSCIQNVVDIFRDAVDVTS